ncbi:MAG: ACP S-malonyltransferase [Phycisphaeraceae bacterium]|nr:ACP S-malonyltransferase [Phycisphaerales bacterium]MCB9861312.1 ACP S-malonyltransferase [Phycisphaeraceae bacterium]
MTTETTTHPSNTSSTSVATGLIVLCPGQGAQAVGMGKMWCEKSQNAKAVFDLADGIVGNRLGEKLSTLCFEGPADVLNHTDVSQPALYTCAVACWRGLMERSDFERTPLVAAMGLSLGEYTALHIAGAIDFESGLELVLLRGRAMQDAAEQQQGGMVALIGADEAQALEVCDKARVDDVLVCANFNAPGQIVISGHKSACDRAVDVATEMKLRATPLTVAGAFHSPLMQPAADRLSDALAQTTFRIPKCTVLANVDVEAHPGSTKGPIMGRAATDPAQLSRDLLARQLTSSVRWSDSCMRLASVVNRPREQDNPSPAEHIDWHELAPGKTLMGLMRRINRDVKVMTHDEPESPN